MGRRLTDCRLSVLFVSGSVGWVVRSLRGAFGVGFCEKHRGFWVPSLGVFAVSGGLRGQSQWSRSGVRRPCRTGPEPAGRVTHSAAPDRAGGVANGVLTPTRDAADDQRLIRRLRSWFTGDELGLLVTELALARVAATGPRILAVEVVDFLGPVWITPDGQRVTVLHVGEDLSRRASSLHGLELILADSDIWRAGPSARWLLPGATLLAHRWTPVERRVWVLGWSRR